MNTNSKDISPQNQDANLSPLEKKIKSFQHTPHDIKRHLDRYVIGQDDAKKVLAVAAYNHYKRITNNLYGSKKKAQFEKSNVLLIGNTGCGKTYLVRMLAKLLNVPCYIQDCTKITASGYVGSDVEDCIVGLLRQCNYEVDKAQMGIVVLDEVDKIAKREVGPSITRDVSGECVQQSLLKIIEGDSVGVPPNGGRIHPEQLLLYVETTNILFIASGAFVGLENIVYDRINHGKGKMPDGPERYNLLDQVTASDLHKFGMIPEFVGRFHNISRVLPLKKEDYKRILTEPKNSLVQQYTEMLAQDDVVLEFDDSALDKIADIAMSMENGARSLRYIMEKSMLDIMYDAPSLDTDNRHIVVTDTMVQECFYNRKD